MEFWQKFLKTIVIPFGLIGLLSGITSHEMSQARELENNKTIIDEQGKRIDRYELKMDKLLDRIDAQNDKIDNLRIEVLKRR